MQGKPCIFIAGRDGGAIYMAQLHCGFTGVLLKNLLLIFVE